MLRSQYLNVTTIEESMLSEIEKRKLPFEHHVVKVRNSPFRQGVFLTATETGRPR